MPLYAIGSKEWRGLHPLLQRINDELFAEALVELEKNEPFKPGTFGPHSPINYWLSQENDLDGRVAD